MFINKGQTLVALLFFMVIAITITTAAIVIVLVNADATTKLQQSTLAYYVAESGIENALLRILRDTNYAGETLAVGAGNATIQVVNNSGTYTITSSGKIGNFLHTIQAVAVYNNAALAVSSWKETF